VGTPFSERIVYVQKIATKKENVQIGIPESRTHNHCAEHIPGPDLQFTYFCYDDRP
jgi:hypothetical protein